MFNTLVLSGGSIKGFATLGALQYFSMTSSLDGITKFYGTSIGAVLCCLLACGYSPKEIFTHFFENDIDVSSQDVIENVPKLFLNYGMLDFSVFSKHIKSLILDKFRSIPTFKKLKILTNKSLFVTSVNLTTNEVVYFSADTHPDMDILQAVEMSCNVPLFFTKRIYNGDYYIDGAFGDHIPCKGIDFNKEKVLCIVTKQKKSTTATLSSYFHNIFLLPITMNSQKTLKYLKNQKVTLVDIRVNDVNGMNDISVDVDMSGVHAKITAAQKQHLFEVGYKTAASEIEKSLTNQQK